MKSGNPDLVIVFRHCDKLGECVKGTYPECCTGKAPPQSCDDCSPKGYMRAEGLYASLQNLLEEIAPGRQVTDMYAAGSKDINSGCPSSRRTWELLVPASSELQLPIDTKYCSTDNKAAAADIIGNPGSIVVVSWEHTNIPDLVGWIMAMAVNPQAEDPVGDLPKWHGDVFDQYWVVDMRCGKPRFNIYPEKILPGDCPFARRPNGTCPSGTLVHQIFGTSATGGPSWIPLVVTSVLLILFVGLTYYFWAKAGTILLIVSVFLLIGLGVSIYYYFSIRMLLPNHGSL
jgi:hypothetical protein